MGQGIDSQTVVWGTHNWSGAAQDGGASADLCKDPRNIKGKNCGVLKELFGGQIVGIPF